MKSKKGSESTIHQLKVTLDDVTPPIWRRIQVQSDMPLDVLHDIFQVVMGWDDSHLHLFRVGMVNYTTVNEPMGLYLEDGDEDESEATLVEIAPKVGAKFFYEYDFGDSWTHTVLVEKVLPYEEDTELPRVLDGKRACPPEDCGGPWGYASLLEALADPKNPEHADSLEWLGDDFDPEEFDVDGINETLSFEDGFEGLLTEGQIDMMIDLSIAEIGRAIVESEHTPGSGSFILKLQGATLAFASLAQVILSEFGDLETVKFVIELGPGLDAPVILRVSGEAAEVDRLWELLGNG